MLWTEGDDVESESSKLKLLCREQEAQIKELEFDLRDVDMKAKRVENEKIHVVKTADREMHEAKVSIVWLIVTFYMRFWYI